MQDMLKVLDCTLRDGGFALEDFSKNGIRTASFTEEERRGLVENARDAGIDIIELGCMSEADKREEFAIYESIEEISKYIPERINETQMYVGFYRGPDTELNKIPEYSPEFIDGIRVIIRYSEIRKSLDFCAALSKKGYKVFIQPMLTMRYSDDELEQIIYAANEMQAFACYFVDSYGYMEERDVERLFRYYGERLDSDINIGFHAHNNLEMAFSNVRYFIERLHGRKKIVDSCAIGMGQGAGNLQTEILIHYINQKYGIKYEFDNVLEMCDILEKFRMHDMETWGYSPVRMIPAIHNAAYKYAVVMRVKYHMSLVEINRILSMMPEDLRHRYTAENLKELIGKNDCSRIYNRYTN